MKEQYVCSKCHSDKIQVRVWFNPNTNTTKDWCNDSCDDTYECWCEECNEMTEVHVTRYNKYRIKHYVKL